MCNSFELTLRWIPQNTFHDKTTFYSANDLVLSSHHLRHMVSLGHNEVLRMQYWHIITIMMMTSSNILLPEVLVTQGCRVMGRIVYSLWLLQTVIQRSLNVARIWLKYICCTITLFRKTKLTCVIYTKLKCDTWYHHPRCQQFHLG